MFRKVIIAAGIVVATASLLEAHSDRGGKGKRGRDHHAGRGAMAERMAEKLNLTAEQKSAIREIHQREREAGKGLRADLRQKSREYRELERSNDPRAAAVREELEAMRGQMKQNHERIQEEVQRVLTPEQRIQMEQMKSQRRGKHRGK